MTDVSHAELARHALRRIAALQLPPTPENFSRFYQEAAGTELRPRVPEDNRALVARVEELVDRASATADSLASDLGERNDGLAAAIHDHGATRAVDHAARLDGLLATTTEILSIVRASQKELLDTRQSLDRIKIELDENRKMLGQDPLTGTDNRRSMESILEREIAHSRREGEPLAVAMIDLDHFKRINDQYGHAAGDAALIHLTTLANAVLRGNDAFIRYGGEEFVLVLPGTALQGGVFAAERLQSLLARRPLLYVDKRIAMTFSAGVAVLAPDEEQHRLLQRADAALYEAKRSGRNRVMEATLT